MCEAWGHGPNSSPVAIKQIVLFMDLPNTSKKPNKTEKKHDPLLPPLLSLSASFTHILSSAHTFLPPPRQLLIIFFCLRMEEWKFKTKANKQTKALLHRNCVSCSVELFKGFHFSVTVFPYSSSMGFSKTYPHPYFPYVKTLL